MINEIIGNKNEILVKIYNEESNLKTNSENFIKFHPKKFKQNISSEKYFRIKSTNTIASLKMLLSDIENISSEKIHIFFLDKKEELNTKGESKNLNLILLKKIKEDFLLKNKSFLEDSKDTYNINDIKIRLDTDSYPNLFYAISDSNNIKYFNNNIPNYISCVIIDLYQQNIDKIIFNLETNCSIFLLKNIIITKLNNDNNINISQIKLFCIDVTEINEEKNTTTNIKNEENSFPDWKNLNDIIECFFPKEIDERNNFKYNIHFFLTITNEVRMSEQIGLNFRFNYLKDVSKISFDENAPKYCECSDGINLFIFCFNQDCPLCNKYFVVNIGYGVFNIFKQAKKIKCPECNDDNLELKNIGIINSRYYYKGFMKTKNKQKSIIEGDNITLDDKLYIFKETKINSFLLELYMEAKPHFVTPGKNNISKRTEEDEELDDIYLSDNINRHKNPLLSFDFNANSKTLKGIKNQNNIKIYDNESDLIDKNDIIIDDIDSKILDKVNCTQNASIFYPLCFYEDDLNKNKNCEENYYTDKLSVCFIF